MSALLLENKNAVIHGGGGAIGGAVARVFAREGARVFIAGRTQAKLDAVARDITAAGGTVETALVDVFDPQAVEEHADAVATTAGRIDIALNAVSVMHDQGTLLADLSLEEFMRPIDGFLRALFTTSKAVARHMGGDRPGVILTLSEPGAKMAAEGQGTLLKRLPTLAEVAETAAFLASDRTGTMTGTVVNLSGGALVD
jgi:NAD(P)-dependent dehydrogenase (short-subunit alcohol dehydrogenase family)